MRQCIERAFGTFIARLGIFRRPFVFKADIWGLVLGVCAKLHNYCIRQGDPKPSPPMSSDVQHGDEEVVLDNAHSRGEVTRTGGTGSTTRRTLTAALGKWGQIRPQSNHAHGLSV
jgi:hypothetical protein